MCTDDDRWDTCGEKTEGGWTASAYPPTPASLQSNPNATWTLSIAPFSTSIGFNEPITFTITGLDPSYGTPVFTSSTVTSNATTVTTKLTLSQSPHAKLQRDSRFVTPFLACCIAFLFPFRKMLKSYRSQLALMLVMLALAAFTLTGCEIPPATFTVTATGGAISHTLTLTLQPGYSKSRLDVIECWPSGGLMGITLNVRCDNVRITILRSAF